MINAGFVDFVFTGAAIVPEVLFFAGYVGEAILLLVPLLIAACLISMYHDNVVAGGVSDSADQPAINKDGIRGEQDTRQA